MTTPDQELLSLEKIAREAGQEILRVYGTEDFQIVSKDDSSPLTAADLASHKAIEKGLLALTPKTPILSEESKHLPWDTRRSWTRYWLVDPLDGTKEFIKRNGEFTVNIALIEDGKPVCGVVYVPVQDETYFGRVGAGAWKRDAHQNLSEISIQKAGDPLVIACSRSHPSEKLTTYLERFENREMKPLGSSLKFCQIAEGLVDFYPRLGLTSEWDTAAAQAVLEGAGGQIIKLDGTPLRYNTKDSLLNPHFHAFGDAALLEKIL